MSTINITDEKTVFYSKYFGNFDTPKKLNRSSTDVPSEFIEAIEAGEVKSEMIKKLEKNFPIFTYQSCLTIHGNLPTIERSRIGNYKNLIQNKNGSLEIRWSAIDYQAKKSVAKCLRFADKWAARENSQTGIYFEKTERTESRQEALELIQTMRKECEAINIDGFTAKMFVTGYSYFGRFYVILTVLPYAINIEPLELIQKLTGLEKQYFINKITEENEEQAKRAQASEQAKQISEAAKDQACEMIKTKKMVQISSEIGKAYIVATVAHNKPAFRFYRISSKGTFGRVIAETYLSFSPELDPSKFEPFMKGKQIKVSEITTKQVFEA